MSFPMRRFLRAAVLVSLLAVPALLAGCATADPDDSELPWNTPQPWEGSPMIPGLESR